MRKVTVRDLRNNFSKVEAWLGEGEEICIQKKGVPIAVLKGFETATDRATPVKPDFAARRRTIWGDKVFSAAEVAAMRAAELEAEEG